MTAGCAGYVISVRLVGQGLGTVLDCRLTTSWDDEIVLASFNDEGDSMCRLGLLQYPRDQVLNLRIQNSLRFQRGQMIEGVILATGVNPIPEAYRHGLIVPITVAFLDQNENQVRETADLLWIGCGNRSTNLCRARLAYSTVGELSQLASRLPARRIRVYRKCPKS